MASEEEKSQEISKLEPKASESAETEQGEEQDEGEESDEYDVEVCAGPGSWQLIGPLTQKQDDEEEEDGVGEDEEEEGGEVRRLLAFQLSVCLSLSIESDSFTARKCKVSSVRSIKRSDNFQGKDEDQEDEEEEYTEPVQVDDGVSKKRAIEQVGDGDEETGAEAKKSKV